MLNAILVAVHFVILAFSGHKQVALENAVLRQRLAVFKRDVKRPKLHGRDRLFWIALRMIWTGRENRLATLRHLMGPPHRIRSCHRMPAALRWTALLAETVTFGWWNWAGTSQRD